MKKIRQKLSYLFLTLLLAVCVSCDPCNKTTCLNGATCDEGTCLCRRGFIGPTCEEGALFVKKIVVKSWPELKPDGANWDTGYGKYPLPDLWLRAQYGSRTQQNDPIYNATPNDKVDLIWGRPLKINNSSTSFRFTLYDFDTTGGDSVMDHVRINLYQKAQENYFPDRIILQGDRHQAIFEIFLTYSR